MKTDESDWKRMWFKGNKVWAAVDAGGKPRIDSGRVLIKYRLDQDYEYKVNPRNLSSADAPPPGQPGPSSPASKTGTGKRPNKRPQAAVSRAADIPDNAIRLYTDGASLNNPGPAGIGVLLSFGSHDKELSEYIGRATNNVAELKAIQAGLAEVKNKTRPVRLFTDSGYAFGLLVLNWKPKKNQALVADIKTLMSTFEDLKFIKVKGHAGDPGNERADHLATSAARQARISGQRK